MNNSSNHNRTWRTLSENPIIKNFSGNENQWPQSRRDYTKRDSLRYVECYDDRNSYNKFENSRDIGNKVPRQQQVVGESVQQATAYPSYNYNSTNDLFVDKNRCTTSSVPVSMEPIDSVNSPRPTISFENMAMNQHSNLPALPMTGRLNIVQSSTLNVIPYDFSGASGENMYSIPQTGNYWQYGGMTTQNKLFSSVKQVVKLKNCVLYPPEPNASLPTARKRPVGCKMVFVRGLPEKITEEIITEIFEQCGIIESIKMSKRNSCRIKFSNESYVDKALYFSGYVLKIENKDDDAFTAILHVDYSLVSDVQHDYECKQHAKQRQDASDKKKDRYKSPAPSYFSEYEASLICEKLKKEETFTKAATVLITWLEKGVCTKKNASFFFSMIQSTHNHVLNHVKKLEANKVKYKEQLNETKTMLKKNQESIISQYKESEKIYKAASLQKCWDLFTKAQRKNIEMWKKQTEELKNAHLEEVINEREDEEMELSDDENDAASKKDAELEQLKKQYEEDIHKYQEEINSLKCQLQAAQNEILVIQSDHKNELELKDNEMASVKQTVISLKEELNDCQKRKIDFDELNDNEPCSFKRQMTKVGSDNDKDFNSDNEKDFNSDNDKDFISENDKDYRFQL